MIKINTQYRINITYKVCRKLNLYTLQDNYQWIREKNKIQPIEFQ